jgi:outer membrane murein-binding lipoprotein Lpp
MMKKKIGLALIAVILLLPIVLAGCQEGGIAQETYDKVVAEFNEIKAKYTDALTKYDELKAEKDAVDAQLQDCQAKNAQLESQIAALKGEYELTGATLTETAEKIVKYYHETHVYSTYDLFVCSDMAAEVWNMLKAQGIDSIIVVGNKDAAISDILQSNHAWVLAQVEGGKYLALETTGGYSVSASKNPLYYRGWSFDSPADLKSYNALVREYNVRVGFRNLLADEVNDAAELHNNAASPTEAEKWLALYDKLKELKVDQENILNDIMTQINGLAAVLQ